ncbi:MAG: hypothetical protein ACI841_004644 [Planctomycetota bacterium]
MLSGLGIAMSVALPASEEHDPSRARSSEPTLEPFAQAAGRDSFERAHASVRDLLDDRKWKGVEAAVMNLLKAHTGADYVRPHLLSLREDLRRAAFWKSVDEPKVKDLIQGKLLKYSPSTGHVRVQYTNKTLEDFELRGAAHYHPMHFSDSWKIDIEGTHAQVAGLAYFVAIDADQGYMLRFGNKPPGSFSYTQHFAQRVRGTDSNFLASEDPYERKGKKKTVNAQIQVGKRSIRMKYDGKKVIDVDKKEDDYGSLALVGETDLGAAFAFGTITIDGDIDRGWLDGVRDEVVAKQREVFDAAWKDPVEFDTWTEVEPDDAEELSLPQLFGRLKFRVPFENPTQEKLLKRVQDSFGKGYLQASSNLKEIDSWPEGTLLASSLAFLRLSCAFELQRPTLALQILDQIEVQPEHAGDLELLRAELLMQTNQLEQAHTAFAAIAAAMPASSLAHVRSAEALLLLGRPADAHRAILTGLQALPTSKSLRKLEVKVVKASKGPSWEKVYMDKGKHFYVRTDVDRKLVRQARLVLDDAWKNCEDFFGPLPAGALPEPRARGKSDTWHSVAYLFSGESSYVDYVEGVANPGIENTLGVYSPVLKQIAAWNQPNVEDLWETLRHEVAHRYLDLQIDNDLPRWLNEGLAECFQSAWNEEGDYEPGGLLRDSLHALKGQKDYPSIFEFMTRSEEAFLQEGSLGYAQAWSLIHYLRFGPSGPRSLFDNLMAGLREGKDPQLAIRDAIDLSNLTTIQQGLVTWINARLREL